MKSKERWLPKHLYKNSENSDKQKLYYMKLICMSQKIWWSYEVHEYVFDISINICGNSYLKKNLQNLHFQISRLSWWVAAEEFFFGETVGEQSFLSM